MGICFPDRNTSVWKITPGSETKAIVWTQILDLFCLGSDHQSMEHSEALRPIVRSESIRLIFMCVKAGNEAIHNLNGGQNVVEMVYLG